MFTAFWAVQWSKNFIDQLSGLLSAVTCRHDRVRRVHSFDWHTLTDAFRCGSRKIREWFLASLLMWCLHGRTDCLTVLNAAFGLPLVQWEDWAEDRITGVCVERIPRDSCAESARCYKCWTNHRRNSSRKSCDWISWIFLGWLSLIAIVFHSCRDYPSV